MAYWSAQATLTSTASAGSIDVTLENVSSLQKSFFNHTLTTTGSVTVTNTSATTSTTAMPVSIDFSATGSSELANDLNVTVWGPTDAADCTAGAAPVGTTHSGSWSDGLVVHNELVAGQSKTWCVRTMSNERSELASAAGTQSISPTVNATLSAGDWTASATESATQETQFIYPAGFPDPGTSWVTIHPAANTDRCITVNGAGAGSALVDAACGTGSSQQFQFGAGDSYGYLSVIPRHAQTLRWDNGGSTTPGSAITVLPMSSSGNQTWQFQRVSAGVYQIVNKNSGLCLSAQSPTTNTQNHCDGTLAQQFTVDRAPAIPLNGFTCRKVGGNEKVEYSWSTAGAGSYTFQASDGSTWHTIGTTVAGSTSIVIDGTLPAEKPLIGWDKNTYDIRGLDSNSEVVATAKIDVNPNGGKLKCG